MIYSVRELTVMLQQACRYAHRVIQRTATAEMMKPETAYLNQMEINAVRCTMGNIFDESCTDAGADKTTRYALQLAITQGVLEHEKCGNAREYTDLAIIYLLEHFKSELSNVEIQPLVIESKHTGALDHVVFQCKFTDPDKRAKQTLYCDPQRQRIFSKQEELVVFHTGNYRADFFARRHNYYERFDPEKHKITPEISITPGSFPFPLTPPLQESVESCINTQLSGIPESPSECNPT